MSRGKQHKKWDKEKCGVLIEMVKQGYSAKVIADKFNIIETSVYGKVIKLKKDGWDIPTFTERKSLSLYCRRGCLSEEDKRFIKENANVISTKETADWLGCSVETVRAYQKAMGIKAVRFVKWSPQKRNKIVQLLSEGWQLKDVADELGTTEKIIREQLSEMRKSGIEVPTLWQFRKIKTFAYGTEK